MTCLFLSLEFKDLEGRGTITLCMYTVFYSHISRFRIIPGIEQVLNKYLTESLHECFVGPWIYKPLGGFGPGLSGFLWLSVTMN